MADEMANQTQNEELNLSEQTQIGPEETAGELTERLANIGAVLLIRTLAPYIAGDLTPEKQDEASLL